MRVSEASSYWDDKQYDGRRSVPSTIIFILLRSRLFQLACFKSDSHSATIATDFLLNHLACYPQNSFSDDCCLFYAFWIKPEITVRFSWKWIQFIVHPVCGRKTLLRGDCFCCQKCFIFTELTNLSLVLSPSHVPVSPECRFMIPEIASLFRPRK